MKLITERDMIRNVANHWKASYYAGGQWESLFVGSSETIWKKLEALDKETASPQDVADIIGNSTWVECKCDECGCGVGGIVQVGEEPDYESHTAELCFTCLLKAVKLIDL